MVGIPKFADWWQQTPEGIEAVKQHAKDLREEHEALIASYGVCCSKHGEVGAEHKVLVAAAKAKRDSTKLAAVASQRELDRAIREEYGATAPLAKKADRLKNEIQNSSGLYSDAVKMIDKLIIDLRRTAPLDQGRATGKFFPWGGAELVPVSNRESIQRRSDALMLAKTEVSKIMVSKGNRRKQLEKLFAGLPKIELEDITTPPIPTVV